MTVEKIDGENGFGYGVNRYGGYYKSREYGQFYNVRLDKDPPEMYSKGRDWEVYKILDRLVEIVDAGKRPTKAQCEWMTNKYRACQARDLTRE